MKAVFNRTLILSLVSASALFAQSARADSSATPPNEIRVGMYAVFYDLSARDISGPYAPPGLNLSVKNVQTPYFAYERSLSQHFILEIAAGWPPLTKTYGRGPATVGSVPFNGQEISSARWLAPSMLLNYKFFDDTWALRPYIGVGFTYVNFYDRESTAAGDAVSGGPTRVSLTSSIGPTGTVGLAYKVSRNWGIYASYSVARVRTNLTADTAGIYRFSHLSFQPGALVVSAGYSF
jgi:outer membrane protein